MVVNNVISFLLHLRFIVHVIGGGFNDGGPVFLALCVFPHLMRQFMPSDLWSKGAIADVNCIPSTDWPVHVVWVSLCGQCSEHVLHSQICLRKARRGRAETRGYGRRYKQNFDEW